MALKHFSTGVIVIALIINSCTTNTSQVPIATASPTRFILTATLPLTLTPPPTTTLLPPPPTSTVTPVEGITSTQVNVRAEPSTVSEVLGVLLPNTSVEIVGKDPGESWWQILYPQGTQEKGWVTAQYVTTASTPEVPVVGADPNPNDGNVAIIQQQLNVRSGPGADFNSLGTLNPQDVVSLLGKDANGVWLQIDFASGPDGKGWISAAFVQAQGVEDLPIIGDTGQVIGTGTPVDTPLPPSPTVVPAPNDNDSAQTPAVDIVFSANGTRTLQYSSDISSPAGDSDDWIQFKTYTETVYIEMICLGDGQLNAEFLLENQFEANWGNGPCGGSKVISIRPNTTYLLHIQIAASTTLTYVQYTLKIISIP